MAGPLDFQAKILLATKAIEDIITLLFLIDAGFVRIGSTRCNTEEFLSSILSSKPGPIECIRSIVHTITGDALEHHEPGDTAFTIMHVDPRLFDGSWMATGMLGSVNAVTGWRTHLELFKDYRWSIDGNGIVKPGTKATITPAILGKIHELDASAEGKDDVKKSMGVYYTPSAISRYICNRCIHEFLATKAGLEGTNSETLVENADPGKLEEILTLLDHVHVLDPCCGTGEFLVTAADAIFSLTIDIARKITFTSKASVRVMKARILSKNIFGAELSREAISIAKKRLWLWCMSGWDNGEIEQHVNFMLPSLDESILNGNALIGWLDERIDNSLEAVLGRERRPPLSEVGITTGLSRQLESKWREHRQEKIDLEPYRPLHWRLKFRDVFKKNHGFDIVVGNPPYVFIRGHNFDEIERAYFSTWYFQGISTITRGKARQSGKVNAFSLFIARSVRLLADGGILGFIVPNTLLRTTTNDITRQFITMSTFVREIVDLQDGIFTGVVASTIILILEKSASPTGKRRTIVKHCVQDLPSGQYQSHEIDQARFLRNTACIFDIHVDDQFATIFQMMQVGSFPLGEACSEIIEGLVTRQGDKMFSSDPVHPKAKKMLRGKDVDRYALHWPAGQYIIYDPANLHRARPVGVHEAPVKLLTQRIGGGTYPLRVAYDDRQHYFFASINAIILKKGENGPNAEQEYKYILAILNSALMNAYYFLNFSNKSALTVNVSKTFLGSLPIKVAAPAKRHCIARIVDYLLYMNEHGNGENDLLVFFDKELLDAIIFDLYTCRDQEVYFFGAMLSMLHEIDPQDYDRRNTMAIIKEASAHVKADGGCMAWLRNVQSNADFKAIKDLFKERVDGIVD
jgi:adenine-specific DNA-methyltransferase